MVKEGSVQLFAHAKCLREIACHNPMELILEKYHPSIVDGTDQIMPNLVEPTPISNLLDGILRHLKPFLAIQGYIKTTSLLYAQKIGRSHTIQLHGQRH